MTSNAKSDVFLNDKLIGQTPLCKCKEGEYLPVGLLTVKIVPQDSSLSPFTAKVNIVKGALTAIDKTFLPGSLGSSYVLSLEKLNSSESQLFIASLPSEALVSIDGSAQGVSPFLAKNIPPSEHEIEIRKEGYNKKTIRVRTVPSYKLIANIILGTELKLIDQEASASASLTPFPSSPSATLTIKNTPTGFLRVRLSPSLSSSEVARVLPGDKLKYLEEQEDWYKVELDDGKIGWISSLYAQKN